MWYNNYGYQDAVPYRYNEVKCLKKSSQQTSVFCDFKISQLCSAAAIKVLFVIASQIARFMRPPWGPPGSCRAQMGPMLAPCWNDMVDHVITVSDWISHKAWASMEYTYMY